MDRLWSITDHYEFKKIFNDPYHFLPDKEDEDAWEFNRFRYHAMYTVIDNEWVIPLAVWIKQTLNSGVDSCIEIMSGRGWLAKALDLQGIEIKATDDGSDYLDRSRVHEYPAIITDAVYDVDKMTANEIAKYISIGNHEENKKFLVIISYPPDNDVAYEFVKLLPKGTLILYIGDEDFDLTASEDFKRAVTWLDEPQHENHPEAFRLKNFPIVDVQGVGNDDREENTVTAVIKLGII